MKFRIVLLCQEISEQTPVKTATRHLAALPVHELLCSSEYTLFLEALKNTFELVLFAFLKHSFA